RSCHCLGHHIVIKDHGVAREHSKPQSHLSGGPTAPLRTPLSPSHSTAHTKEVDRSLEAGLLDEACSTDVVKPGSEHTPEQGPACCMWQRWAALCKGSLMSILYVCYQTGTTTG
ncbi:hypothetical protein JOQ06_017568, partial [Pogonophryne albipinna]